MALTPEDNLPQRPGRLVFITPTVQIPRSELRFSFARSSGPGGQNVNKVNTRVTLRFDVRQSEGLTDTQKARISRVLNQRIDKTGQLQIASDRFRTQARNKKETIDRFVKLLVGALRVAPKRLPTKPTAGSVNRRLNEKTRRSQLKDQRSRPPKREE